MSTIAGHRPTSRNSNRRIGGHGCPARAVALGVMLTVAGLASPGPSLAANCGTPSHNASLSTGAASPGSGSTATIFVFTVDYSDNAGCTPTVSLIIPGVGTFGMSATGDGSGNIVTYGISKKLPAGTWAYRFRATSGSNGGAVNVTLTTVSPRSIVVSSPPTPPPTPKATPSATAKATPKPTPKPVAQATPSADPSPADTPASTRTPRPTSSPTPRSSPSPAAGGADTTGGGGPGDGGPFGGLAGFLALGTKAAHLAEGPYLPVTSWVASCVLGLLTFAVVLRRRRDERPGEGELFMMSPFGSSLPATDPAPPFGALGDSPIDEPADPEATIPRWRRPSVQAARQSRSATATVSMPVRFTTAPRPGDDRRVVGYRLVRVADSPDEVRSAELGRFDRGDEVEVLEAGREWTRVRGASGLEGWVLSQTVLSSAPPWAEDQPGR